MNLGRPEKNAIVWIVSDFQRPMYRRVGVKRTVKCQAYQEVPGVQEWPRTGTWTPAPSSFICPLAMQVSSFSSLYTLSRACHGPKLTRQTDCGLEISNLRAKIYLFIDLKNKIIGSSQIRLLTNAKPPSSSRKCRPGSPPSQTHYTNTVRFSFRKVRTMDESLGKEA